MNSIKEDMNDPYINGVFNGKSGQPITKNKKHQAAAEICEHRNVYPKARAALQLLDFHFTKNPKEVKYRNQDQ